MDPAELVHTTLLRRLRAGDVPARRHPISLAKAEMTAEALLEIAHSQIVSRQLDRTSRKLQARGESFYTIGSSGHEGVAAVAAALRPTDMAFLHYRDGAFQVQRAKQVPGQTPIWDMLLSFAASAEDPISGGRHKVLGSKALFIPPQTSTIASHLPKAMGAAYAIGLATRLGVADAPLARDAVIACSFGDASANHSTAVGAINATCWASYQGAPMPVLFVCEDNGIGISTRTPMGWIEAAYNDRPGMRYVACDGLDILHTYCTARDAIARMRADRVPTFLHLSCVRLYGHAGPDVQAAYLTKSEVERIDANDPLLHTASLLADLGIVTPDGFADLYEETGETITRVAEDAIKRPKLETAAAVMASIVPPPAAPRRRVNTPSTEAREAAFGTDLAMIDKPQPMVKLLNWALTDLMLQHGEIVLAGEDIGPKGGVYGVTLRLHARFGPNRVINTLLDEQTILGLAIGLAHNGLLCIPEIQFLAYVHNAEDQIRGEAATLSFFSSGQYTNPMVVRIPGLGYQKGFGGHFHNDNSLTIFRDIPGLILAVPSNGRDAVLMLRECVRLAREEQRVVIFVEPIALYATRDLHEDKDGLWAMQYPGPDSAEMIRLGDVGRHGDGEDVAIVTYGNGVYLSLQAQKILAETHSVRARIIDLRWLSPLNIQGVLDAIGEVRDVLIVDECRRSGSTSEALMTAFAEQAPALRVARITAEDSFIPLGRAATLTLPNTAGIVAGALDLVRRS